PCAAPGGSARPPPLLTSRPPRQRHTLPRVASLTAAYASITISRRTPCCNGVFSRQCRSVRELGSRPRRAAPPRNSSAAPPPPCALRDESQRRRSWRTASQPDERNCGPTLAMSKIVDIYMSKMLYFYVKNR